MEHAFLSYCSLFVLGHRKDMAKSRKLNLWSESRMKGAIEEFRTGNKSLRFIARAWNVPLTTLQRRVKGKIQGHKYSLGKSTMLNEQQEAELCLRIKTMSSRGFPMTKSSIQSLAMQFIKANNIKGFNREKEKCGYYWFKGLWPDTQI